MMLTFNRVMIMGEKGELMYVRRGGSWALIAVENFKGEGFVDSRRIAAGTSMI